MIDSSSVNRGQLPRRRVRFSIRFTLVVVAFVAMACALVMQEIRLTEAKASLSRYESNAIPTALGANELRIIRRTVLATDHVMVVTFRIESVDKHSASIRSGGDANSCSSEFDPATNLHFTEATILFDHTKTSNSLKVMAKVGGAQGYSVAIVPDGFSLNDEVNFIEDDGVFERHETVELFDRSGRAYTLSVK